MSILTTKKINVRVNSRSTNINVRNNATLPNGMTRLDALNDVDPTNEANGATLVYNSENDKYEVKPLDLADVTGDLDAGTLAAQPMV